MDINTPLAERMRPESLDEIAGQEHLIAKDGVLRKNLEQGHVSSMIFWGPPGCGKTTLAHVMAHMLEMPFYSLSAVASGVKDVRNVFEKAKEQGTVLLFIDEIHRFSKSQQDALLGAVEKGLVILIGATTENPSFEVISALLSRCQVYLLKPLEISHLETLLKRAIQKDEFLKKRRIEIKETDALFGIPGGDVRKMLNLLELLVNYYPNDPLVINNDNVMNVAHEKIALYDKQGEQHYDIISAFIKSMRGSDPNAAVYWLARMLKGGEKPEFIARRMLILASEDIGNANPTALVMANNCFQAIHVIGMPEARLILSQTAIYLACSTKSNASYKAIGEAERLVNITGDLPVPLHLRNAPTNLMKNMGYAKDYKYAHQHPMNFVDLEYLPEKIKGTTLFKPGNNDREKSMKEFLKVRWKGKYGV